MEMVIRAKFAGRCARCGGAINAGEEINWERGGPTTHVKCPVRQQPAQGELTLYRSGTSKIEAPLVGATLRDHKHGLVTVLAVKCEYIREDGMSFGLMDDSGWSFTVRARPATETEAAPVLAAEAQRQARKEAKARARMLADQIQQQGERPEGDHQPEGERLLDTQTIYGGGDWFVLGSEYIWYVRNNGADGDDWSRNNVQTGGAGGIGWRIPFDPAIANELHSLAQALS